MSPTSMYIAWGWKDIIPQLPALIHAFQTSEMNTPKMRRLCKFTALPEGQRPELPSETNPRLKKLIDEMLGWR
ncbi:unnamed protein product [Arabidopsis thaliana]|uniref:Uncharacterized protein n=1 Tax=Arabidopsis thaliana TaxID=3702 RepID=A0A654ECM0_ARATH|nr:unnamed protein product [Arabidopsis thaliana]